MVGADAGVNDSDQRGPKAVGTSSRQPDPCQLFAGVVFWINPAIEDSERQKVMCQRAQQGTDFADSPSIHDLITEYGGQAVSARSAPKEKHGEEGARSSLEKLTSVCVNAHPQVESHCFRFSDGLTHVISTDTYFAEYRRCVSRGISVVTPNWMYAALRNGYRHEEAYYSPDPLNIFSGMVVCSSRLPPRDREVLYGIIQALGGQWRDNLGRDVTHLTLLSPTGAKYDKAMSSRKLGIRAVLPHWFQLCISLQRIIPDTPYLFPDPPILDPNFDERDATAALTSTPVAVSLPTKTMALDYNKNNSNGSEQDSEKRLGENGSAGRLSDEHRPEDGVVTLLPRPTRKFLKNYGMAIDSEMRAAWSPEWICALEGHLLDAGATLVKHQTEGTEREAAGRLDWTRVDILICQYRRGVEYVKASRLGKIVGTYIWLYHVFSAQKLADSPLGQLLHYPLPPEPIPEMTGCVISISNYRLHAREYLKRLIWAMGARYTPYFTRQNTHLICAAPFGEKHRKALKWNIHVVHHVWLERCFQTWSLRSVSHRQYNTWAPGGMLQAIVGQCGVDVRTLERWVPRVGSGSAELLSDLVDAGAIPASSGIDDIDAEPDQDSRDEGNATVREDEQVEETDSEADEQPDGHRTVASPVVSDAAKDNSPPEQVSLTYTHRRAAANAAKALGELMQAANAFEEESRLERTRKRSSRSRRQNQHHANTQSDTMGTTAIHDPRRATRTQPPGPLSTADVATRVQPNGSDSSPETNGPKRQHSTSSDGGLLADRLSHTLSTKKRKKTVTDLASTTNREKGPGEDTSQPQAATGERQPKRQRKSKSDTRLVLAARSDDDQDVNDMHVESRQTHQQPRILFTGFRPSEREEQRICEMEGDIVYEVSEATHLVSDGIKRTAKFLEAICHGGQVAMVSPQWVKDSLARKKWQPIPPISEVVKASVSQAGSGYWLSDQKAEQTWQFSLIESLQRAQNSSLLQGTCVYITPKTKPDIQTLKPLVESAGGTVVSQLLPSRLSMLVSLSREYYGKVLSREHSTVDLEEQPSSPPLVVISCSADRPIWSKMFGDPPSPLPVYKSEFLISGILRQQLEFDKNQLAEIKKVS
ncbi:regulator of Ty1 Transposition [Spiromyces aspiralis]|uniref:Regulator of Ty1 Transposition n=1 Tax=Spiromyces aspiralis TaxID=68401 RepID=A0ACC1HVF4_9FUNG|nr:regulator of Ty1 Transposition [Spiromyces aspiralis]